MNVQFDIIIWGSGPEAIARAITLKKSGKKVLLASRFGFPGGKHTESLSSFVGSKHSSESEVEQAILSRAAQLPFGILHQNPTGILLHPEAIKRICWEWINRAELDILFHVFPAAVENHDQRQMVRFFGREGFFECSAFAIENHADNIPLTGLKANAYYKMLINALFSEQLPIHLPGFNVVRNVETPIGRFVTVSIRKVPGTDIDNTFNRELNRLSTESWIKYQSRIRMIPVYPEIISERHDRLWQSNSKSN